MSFDLDLLLDVFGEAAIVLGCSLAILAYTWNRETHRPTMIGWICIVLILLSVPRRLIVTWTFRAEAAAHDDSLVAQSEATIVRFRRTLSRIADATTRLESLAHDVNSLPTLAYLDNATGALRKQITADVNTNTDTLTQSLTDKHGELKVRLDTFTAFVGSAFRQVGTQLEQVSEKVVSLERWTNQINGDMRVLRGNVDATRREIQSIDQELDSVVAALNQIRGTARTIGERVDSIFLRLEVLDALQKLLEDLQTADDTSTTTGRARSR